MILKAITNFIRRNKIKTIITIGEIIYLVAKKRIFMKIKYINKNDMCKERRKYITAIQSKIVQVTRLNSYVQHVLVCRHI